MKMIDKTALGTVQLGMKYGINNTHGKPDREEAFAILDEAYQRGVRTFDTAFAYGDAEDVLGAFFKEREILPESVRIISKLKPHAFSDADELSSGEMATRMEEMIRASSRRLGSESLDGYLFHTPEYIRDERLVAALVHAKQNGLVKNVGVSVYETQDAFFSVDTPGVDYIQAPFNVLDQRLEREGFFSYAQENGVKVFARSPFLQGLLFADADEAPASVASAREHLVVFREIITRHGFTVAEASLLFSYTQPGIDFVVFGAEEQRQLSENLGIIERAETVAATTAWRKCRREIENNFLNMEKHVIFPSLWEDPKEAKKI